MRKQLGDRLPEFTPEEIALVKGSNDFFGINSYGDNYIKHKEGECAPEDFYGNLDVLDQNKAGEWIGPETESVWLRPNPRGFRSLLNWLNKRYGGPTFYVTENGTSIKGENDKPREEILDDEFRCEFFRGYIGALADAYTKDGIDIQGYTGWSLLEYVYHLFTRGMSLCPVLRHIAYTDSSLWEHSRKLWLPTGCLATVDALGCA
jgi:beta-glucosidase